MAQEVMALRVLTLSTLFPDATRPNFGVFVERQTLGLAARQGVGVRVVAPLGIPIWPLSLHPHYKPLTKLPGREMWRDLTIHRERFPVWPGGRHAALVPERIARHVGWLLNHIDFTFDVINAEFFWPDGPAAALLSARFNVPYSIKARGSDIHFWGTRADTARQVVQAGCAADGLLAVSAALKSDMVALGMPAEKIAVHYTGIDRERFRPMDRATAKTALGIAGPLIVTVGALIPRKGQALAIEAMTRLPGATLLIVGGGPDEARLRDLIRARGLRDRVRLLGPRPHEELPGLMAAADVMLLMSESEGLANVWVEAMACGTPIVIGDIGGAREVLKLDGTGCATTAGRLAAFDLDAVARAVRAILADPPPQDAVRAGVERFSWETNAEQLEAHLRRVADKP